MIRFSLPQRMAKNDVTQTGIWVIVQQGALFVGCFFSPFIPSFLSSNGFLQPLWFETRKPEFEGEGDHEECPRLTYPLTARIVGAPQMISQTFFSVLHCPLRRGGRESVVEVNYVLPVPETLPHRVSTRQ